MRALLTGVRSSQPGPRVRAMLHGARGHGGQLRQQHHGLPLRRGPGALRRWEGEPHAIFFSSFIIFPLTAAATKFRCPDLIAENTVCSDLVGRVTLSFLQQREVGTACGEFYRDVENLGLTPDNDGG